MPRRYKVFFAVAAVSLLADQLTKVLARHQLVEHKDVAFLGDFWVWRLSYNTGSAFGMFNSMTGARVLLTLIGVVACGVIFYILRNKTNDRQMWTTWALALVAGGAIGNVIDRLAYAKVTDFIVWRAGKHEWPAFNIADATLVAGVIIMFFDIGKDQKKEKAKEKAASAKGK
jgi:signal peptidase II